MKTRIWILFALAVMFLQANSQNYLIPHFDSLKEHEAPAWFHDAKFGIFIHWGLYSVPAWATPIGEPGKFEWNYFYTNNPYAEWYQNTMKIDGSPTQKHHYKTYGKDFDYYDFIPEFNSEIQKWNPDAMAEVFKEAGAQYVVLTSKHHDSFTLWPAKTVNPNFPEEQPQVARDLVGELTDAVRGRGLKMGLYYSGLDWSFHQVPIIHIQDVFKAGIPEGADYCLFISSHYNELINKYKPDVLWNDSGFPKRAGLENILANYFYLVPEGTVNNRWIRGSGYNGDFKTPEYSKFDSLTSFKWETCRGIGFSFGYNQLESEEEYMSGNEIIELLVDIVSKNGNLLLNVGPKADGSIPAIQKQALLEVGHWLNKYGEGIYSTRPWKFFGFRSEEGTEIRFTKKQETLYMYIWGKNKNQFTVPNSMLPEFNKGILVEDKNEIKWNKAENETVFSISGTIPDTPFLIKFQ